MCTQQRRALSCIGAEKITFPPKPDGTDRQTDWRTDISVYRVASLLTKNDWKTTDFVKIKYKTTGSNRVTLIVWVGGRNTLIPNIRRNSVQCTQLGLPYKGHAIKGLGCLQWLRSRAFGPPAKRSGTFSGIPSCWKWLQWQFFDKNMFLMLIIG